MRGNDARAGRGTRSTSSAPLNSSSTPLTARGALPEGYSEAALLDLIVSKNLARRQLSAGQKAMLALKYEEHYAEAVKEVEQERKITEPANQHTQSSATSADLHSQYERKSATRAAQAVGTSGRSVAQAKAVQRDAPDLADQVRDEGRTPDR